MGLMRRQVLRGKKGEILEEGSSCTAFYQGEDDRIFTLDL